MVCGFMHASACLSEPHMSPHHNYGKLQELRKQPDRPTIESRDQMLLVRNGICMLSTKFKTEWLMRCAILTMALQCSCGTGS